VEQHDHGSTMLVAQTPTVALMVDGVDLGRGIADAGSAHRAMMARRRRLSSTGARRSRSEWGVASYSVNQRAVAKARRLIDARQYVLNSNWGDVQPRADDENAFLESHSWDEYAEWHLGLTEGATEHTKARYAFVYGDFRRVHRMGLIACRYRAAEWRHKEIELAAHDLLQRLDAKHG
jgi:hypothetical protein